MTITYVWSEMRERAVIAFNGELPGAEVEAAVIEVFETHPKLVLLAIEEVGERKRLGKVRSGWAVLRKHLEGATASEEIVATDKRDRKKSLARAEQWIRAAGKHFNVWDEVEDELFGTRGLLRAYRDEQQLREEMMNLWRQVRPEGEQIEDEAIERSERWQETAGVLWRTRNKRPAVADVIADSDPEWAPVDETPPLPELEPELQEVPA